MKQDFIPLPDKDVTEAYIQGGKSSGTVKFYKKNGAFFEEEPGQNSDGVPYIGETGRLAAMLTESADNYICLMDKVILSEMHHH